MTGTCVYKTEITSGSRKWGHLPTIGIPKAIYHYVTNTAKQQPTYQLFQNIIRPKNQLINPPKMKKFNSICAFSRFLLQLWPLKLGQLANQSGSSCHMTCKMAGNGPSRQGSHADIGRVGLLLHDAKSGINLYFPHATQWTKNTFHVILQSILLFLLMQYDGIHFIFINHDNF